VIVTFSLGKIWVSMRWNVIDTKYPPMKPTRIFIVLKKGEEVRYFGLAGIFRIRNIHNKTI